MPNSAIHKRLPVVICFLLAIATLVVYLPVRSHRFVHYDDDTYVTDNPNVLSGLTIRNIKWAFTTGHGSNFHPVTWLSHQLDCTIFGENPGPHHLVNLFWHIANVILLFWLLQRITKRIWPSAFVAALFALHPLHVESVAWVAERKDVLSAFFWLLTMLAYVRYTERPKPARYLLTLLIFIIGLMTKPMLVTLPFCLLLLDYWPLNRLAPTTPDLPKMPGSTIINVFTEKIPFLALSAVSSVITFIVQQRTGAVPSFASLGFKSRLSNAVVSYLAYIAKMFWPARLAVLYPHPADGIPTARAVIFAALLLLITFFLLYHTRRHRYLAFGWLWYLGTLVPVIGIVQVGVQAMADRYTYIPLVGIFIIIAFGCPDLIKKIPFKKYILAAAASVCLIACSITTRVQLGYWKDGFSLFDHTLAVTKNNYVIQNNYATVLNNLGRPADAVEHFKEALRFLPDSFEVHNNYGNALKKLGQIDQAIKHFRFALKLNPNAKLTHYNLALALVAKGQYDQAIKHYKIYLGPGLEDTAKRNTQYAIRNTNSAPDRVEALSNLGYAFAKKGQYQKALEYYQKALAIDGNDIITHGRLALALAPLGRIDQAIKHCRIVLKTLPDDVEMHTNLGILLQNQGKLDEAIACYRRALKIDPTFQKARDYLTSALNQK